MLDALRLAFMPARKIAPAGFVPTTRQFTHDHSLESDRAAITHHYDVSNDFYKLFLDERMVYSCAYFHAVDDTLEAAQRQKLDHICRKLRLQPGERFLDIGCGWGALVIWAAKHYGVHAHGITLSQAQLDEARRRIAAEGLQDRITVELRDYRALEGEGVYDKVSSVGMFEHVGLANLPQYHATVHRVLKPNGLFLNHGITHEEDGWQPSVDTEFINRYVFPDGELDRVSNIQAGMERAQFEIQDVENLRMHYAKHAAPLGRAARGAPRRGDRARQRGDVPRVAPVHGGQCAGVRIGRHGHLPDPRVAPSRRAPVCAASSFDATGLVRPQKCMP